MFMWGFVIGLPVGYRPSDQILDFTRQSAWILCTSPPFRDTPGSINKNHRRNLLDFVESCNLAIGIRQ
jgi:hypothetical protein